MQIYAYKFNWAVVLEESCAASVERRLDPTSMVPLLELELLSGRELRRLNTHAGVIAEAADDAGGVGAFRSFCKAVNALLIAVELPEPRAWLMVERSPSI